MVTVELVPVDGVMASLEAFACSNDEMEEART